MKLLQRWCSLVWPKHRSQEVVPLFQNTLTDAPTHGEGTQGHWGRDNTHSQVFIISVLWRQAELWSLETVLSSKPWGLRNIFSFLDISNQPYLDKYSNEHFETTKIIKHLLSLFPDGEADSRKVQKFYFKRSFWNLSSPRAQIPISH